MPSNIRTGNFVIDFSTTGALAASATEAPVFTCLRPFDILESLTYAIGTANVSGAAVLEKSTGGGGYATVIASQVMTTSGNTVRSTATVAAQFQAIKTDLLRVTFTDGGGTGGTNGHMYVHVLATPITGAA